MKKRSTSILLAALIIFSLLPTNLMTAFAMTDVLTSKKAAQIPFTVLWENQTHTPSDFEGSVCVFVYGDVTCPSTADAVAQCNYLATNITTDQVKYFMVSDEPLENVINSNWMTKYPNVNVSWSSSKLGMGTHASNCLDSSETLELPLLFMLDRNGNYFSFNLGIEGRERYRLIRKLEDLNDPTLFTQNQFNVTFTDYNGTVLSKQTVQRAKPAIAPTNPTREGYYFDGWDTDISRINSDCTISPQYSKINDSKVLTDQMKEIIAMEKAYPHSGFDTSKQTTYATNPSLTAPYSAGSLKKNDINDALNALKMARYLAGVPYENTVFTDELNDIAQHGAVLAAASNQFTHTPTKPSDMDTEFYNKAYKGNSQANISAGISNISSSVLGFIADPGFNNIEEVGHRRWLLGVGGQEYGLGYAQGSSGDGYNGHRSNVHVFKTQNIESSSFVAWPNAGDFPIQYFINSSNISTVPTHPWSISLGKDYLPPERNSVNVVLKRKNENKTWNFNSSTPQLGENNKSDTMHLAVSNTYYGSSKTITFRPDLKTLGSIAEDDVFEVTITGIKNLNGSAATINYTVSFFDLYKEMAIQGDGNVELSNSKVATGYRHTVVIHSDGSMWAFGSNKFGQLGDGTYKKTFSPVKVGTDKDWQAVVAGDFHTLALKKDGTLWAWGSNKDGRLGIGILEDKNVPTQVGTANDWSYITCGDDTSYAIKKDGSLWGWGDNISSVLGDGTENDRLHPKRLTTYNTWQSVSSSYRYSAGIMQDGSLWAWGSNYEGQLGDGTRTGTSTPKKIGNDYNWKSVSCGYFASVAIKKDGTLWSFGSKNSGIRGLETNDLKPTQIGTNTDWKFVNSGISSAVAFKNDGTLWAWGSNSNGETGNSTFEAVGSPVKIGQDTDWAYIDIDWHTVAQKKNGDFYSWGKAGYGQLGASSKDFSIPNLIPILKAKQFSVSPATNKVFKSQAINYKYSDIETYTVTMTNTGIFATGRLNISMSGDSTAFSQDKYSVASISPGETATFAITPMGMLGLGKYTATVSITGTEIETKSFTVQFTVQEKPDYSINISPSTNKTFTAATVGYSAQTSHTVTVSNSGLKSTGILTVALSGENSNSFTLNKTSIASLSTTTTATFTVVPKTGLAVGTYLATVTVGNSYLTAKSFNVSFTVKEFTGPVITIYTQPAESTTFTKGYISGNLTLYAKASNNATLTYQWYSKETGLSVSTASTSPSFTIPKTLAVGTYNYYCLIKATGAVNVKSNYAKIIVVNATTPIITISTQPAATTTVTKGNISGTLSVIAISSTNSALTYQWYSSDTKVAVTGATTATFTIPKTLDVGTYSYYCEVKSSGATTVKSNVATVIVEPSAVTTYLATVENGSGTGDYAQGATVQITANKAQTGKVFSKWITNDGVTFAKENSESTTFIMPAKPVTVTAVYDDITITPNIVQDGWYNLRAMNNYLNITSTGQTEVRTKTSNQAYYVENKGNNQITLKLADNKYLGISGEIKNGVRAQVVASPYLWNVYSENNADINSLRPSTNNGFVLNLSGAKNTDGTPVILSTYSNLNAPNNAELRFIPTTEPVITKYRIKVKATTGGTATGSKTVNENDSITVKATVKKGYIFVGWYEGSKKLNTKTSYTFKATKNISLTAKFTKITANISPSTSKVKKGKTLKLTAKGNASIKSVSWKTSSSKIVSIKTSGTGKIYCTVTGKTKKKKATITAVITFKDGTKKTLKRTISVN